VWESLSQIWGCWDENCKHCLSLDDDLQNLCEADFTKFVCCGSKWWLLITAHTSDLTVLLELCYCASDHQIHLPLCYCASDHQIHLPDC
jgi:hypothetical protein